MSNLLEIKDLTIQYVTEDEVVSAVNGLEIELAEGETIGLVGETGAGKTTTALGIMGLVPNPPGKILSGKITFEGKDLLSLHEEEMRKIRGNKIILKQRPIHGLLHLIYVKHKKAGRKDVRPVDKSAGYGRTDR